MAGQPQPLQPVAIEPAIFALMGGKPAPQQRAALAFIREAAQGEGQRKAHRGRLVAIATGRHVMKPCPQQPLRRQMPVKFGKAKPPGGRLRPPPLELRRRLLKPRDMRTQRVNQRRQILALTKRNGGGASFPAPRKLMCRSNTHDNMIQNVPILFHGAPAESSAQNQRLVRSCAGKA